MAMTLNIPDDEVAAIKWPGQQLDQQLTVKMVFALKSGANSLSEVVKHASG